MEKCITCDKMLTLDQADKHYNECKAVLCQDCYDKRGSESHEAYDKTVKARKEELYRRLDEYALRVRDYAFKWHTPNSHPLTGHKHVYIALFENQVSVIDYKHSIPFIVRYEDIEPSNFIDFLKDLTATK